MFKKTMEFDDLEGNTVTQTFYFNYNKKEIAELIEFGAIQKYADPNRTYIPLEQQLEILSTPVEESGLTNEQNNRVAYAIFEDLILDAYGVKEADNVTFTKNAQLREKWSNHVAYPEMIFEFLENPALAAQFIEKCLPGKMVEAAKKELAAQGGTRIDSTTLVEMVEEANRRQQDPATRIEPGLEAAREALGENPAMEGLATMVKESTDRQALAKHVSEVEGRPAKAYGDLTEEDILAMDDISFAKLDPQKLNKEQMMVAFRRKAKQA